MVGLLCCPSGVGEARISVPSAVQICTRVLCTVPNEILALAL